MPRESKSKFTDLALLSLIYPFNVVSEKMAREIVRHLEYHLERDRGVIRYKNDRYYNKNEDEVSEEAEWCFGFRGWLLFMVSSEICPTPLKLRGTRYSQRVSRKISKNNL